MKSQYTFADEHENGTDVFAGEWFWFFFLQGVACVIESQMKYLWKKKLNLPSIPPVISIPVTLTLLMIFGTYRQCMIALLGLVLALALPD